MATHYCGPATIGGCDADVDIKNVDVSRWNGTATNVRGAGTSSPDALVTLLDQPRPGWSARAEATPGADGVVLLQGTSHFFPKPPVVAPSGRSLWVKKLPRAT